MSVSLAPSSKVIIVGGGLIGLLEAYYLWKEASLQGKTIRITIYEKNASLEDTTAYHLVPSLTCDEIMAVVPVGKAFVDKMGILFSEGGGIRIDDVNSIASSKSGHSFQQEVAVYGRDDPISQKQRELCEQALIGMGKLSMYLWKELYDSADFELKAALDKANFKPCAIAGHAPHNHEQVNGTVHELQNGYRIDLIFNYNNATHYATQVVSRAHRLGYSAARLLTPQETVRLDPLLKSFCEDHTSLNQHGERVWNHDAAAIWKPGGSVDGKMTISLLRDYLTRKVGTYVNKNGVPKNLFRYKTNRKVIRAFVSQDNVITGLQFSNSVIKMATTYSQQTSYILCPGENVGALAQLGFHEPSYARFAGASLKLRVPLSSIPKYREYLTRNVNESMEVWQEGAVLAWQCRKDSDYLIVGTAGTKAFYADVEPDLNDNFATNRNVLQFNTIRSVLPDLVAAAFHVANLPYDETKELTFEDLVALEQAGLAERWVGSRALAYDGFPTLGHVYNDNGRVGNVRCTTHLGSGGVSFGPAAILISKAASNSYYNFSGTEGNHLISNILRYSKSNRSAGKTSEALKSRL